MDKVIVLLSENWHSNTTETLWVVPWFKENSFQIKNVPFYAKGISLDDIIIAEEIDGIKFFRHVLKNGGHSTYRIFLNENIREETFETYWLPLQNLGCTYEKAFIRFYSIEPVSISERWYVWKINDDSFTRVGKLPKKYQNAEIGMVISPIDIVARMQTGEYKFWYPGY